MSVLKINSVWVDQHGKQFVIADLQDDMVWYSHKDVMYSCRIEAFLERFREKIQ